MQCTNTQKRVYRTALDAAHTRAAQRFSVHVDTGAGLSKVKMNARCPVIQGQHASSINYVGA
jgi:hypothetical protein